MSSTRSWTRNSLTERRSQFDQPPSLRFPGIPVPHHRAQGLLFGALGGLAGFPRPRHGKSELAYSWSALPRPCSQRQNDEVLVVGRSKTELSTCGNDRGKKPAAELIAEKPLARRDRAGLIAGIPFVEAHRRLGLMWPACIPPFPCSAREFRSPYASGGVQGLTTWTVSPAGYSGIPLLICTPTSRIVTFAT
jgi:hypothetical protein